MAIQKEPVAKVLENGDKIWEHTFNSFHAKIYVPKNNLPGDIVNFGFSAPYFLVFTDIELSDSQAVDYAVTNKLAPIAADYDSSVVFINPLNDGGWKDAPAGIFEEIIENSKIHQYHKDGYAILDNRFTHTIDGYAIRGAIFRTCLIGKGDAADYIAKNLLKRVDGAGLWGPADVAPTVCVLEQLSKNPENQRRDIPIVSIGNSEEINNYIQEKFDYCLFQDSANFTAAYKFIKQFKRWGWDGELMSEPDFKKIGMIEEPCVVELKTSKDNSGDDAGTESHKVGYISYYNKNLFKKGAVPLVLCFHGGGDSAKHISQVSQWFQVAHDHDFLLVCVENHINSTASEMMELLDILKKQYKIDETRIYASGFSMGGCKTWDLYQEYPDVFAAMAPMDATFDYGCNLYGKPSIGYHGNGTINMDIMVPVFYSGGEITPLPELPCQAEKCKDRMEYVMKVNKCTTPYTVSFNDKDNWADKIWGISGDKIEKIEDKSRDAVLTMNYFKSEDGNYYTVFGSISGQGHECRYHTCEQAWLFMSQFARKEGKIVLL
ncbi:MAG: hypothetical protein MJ179_04445 [Treponema sp.]|nr:hypothetical protein [Treponema sp.]